MALFIAELTWGLLANGDEHRGERKATSRTVPVPTVASSGVGECQEGVKRFGTTIVARFGKARKSAKRAREQQKLGRDA